MTDGDRDRSLLRWMYLWIALGAAIVLVVAGFLFAIAGSLESINSNLEEASEAVAGAESDTEPLPEYVERINEALARVDSALEPIPQQADRIAANLDGVSGTLSSVESELTPTSASLLDVSGALDTTTGLLGGTERQLNDAAGDLTSIRSLAMAIDATLRAGQSRRSLGTEAIWRRVRFANGGRFLIDRNEHGLRSIEGDAEGITRGLTDVNTHLESTCRAIPPVLPPTQLGDGLLPGAPAQDDGEPRC